MFTNRAQDSFATVTREQLWKVATSKEPLIPELDAARGQRSTLLAAPQTRQALTRTHGLLSASEHIPQTSYTAFRLFRRTGDRSLYEGAYFAKREYLAALILRLFLEPENAELKDRVQDYLWSICEESTWVLPAHEPVPIDLFSAETAFVLAVALYSLGDILDAEVRHRVRVEIEQRVLAPYLSSYSLIHWYKCHHNWNGVCNGAVAATFLLLEPEPARVVTGLEIALAGLHTFIENAFEPDGSSTEGCAYWQYGLMNFVALSEMLYARSQGEINLLSSERMRKIAAYPACLQLSGSYFANFSDCNELVHFHPGFITRLAERTQEHSLYNLLAQPVQPEHDWRLTTLLWNVLWWDGTQPEAAQLADARLDDGGVVRMVAQNKQDDGQCVNIVLAAKAGHNDENHNQNDIASFIVHAAGESFLVDPGRGLYTRAYFSPARYENIFANSYGHSVPRIDGHLQGTGRQFAGCLLPITTQEHGTKRVAIDFTHAYPDVDLQRAIRELTLQTEGALAGTLWLRDSFAFASDNHEVEEAFVTWFPCELHDNQARIHGQRHDLLLTLEPPLHFALESLDEQSRANAKASSLQRLSVVLPRGKTMYINIKIQLVAVQTPSA